MIAYRDFRPTPFDPAGLNLPDKQEWLVAPVIRTRDGDGIQEGRWSRLKARLGKVSEEGDGWECHSFNHWACGWFDIAIVDPTRPELVKAAEGRRKKT